MKIFMSQISSLDMCSVGISALNVCRLANHYAQFFEEIEQIRREICSSFSLIEEIACRREYLEKTWRVCCFIPFNHQVLWRSQVDLCVHSINTLDDLMYVKKMWAQNYRLIQIAENALQEQRELLARLVTTKIVNALPSEVFLYGNGIREFTDLQLLKQVYELVFCRDCAAKVRHPVKSRPDVCASLQLIRCDHGMMMSGKMYLTSGSVKNIWVRFVISAPGFTPEVVIYQKPNKHCRKNFFRELDAYSYFLCNSVPHILPFTSIQHNKRFEIKGIKTKLCTSMFLYKRKDFKEWSVKDRYYIFYQMASALAKIHELGFMHGDITSNNIVIENSRTAWLIDFGNVVPLRVEKAFSGGYTTRRMTPPEQLQESWMPAPSMDIWMLGLVALEVLTYEAPFYILSKKFNSDDFSNPDRFEEIRCQWESLAQEMCLSLPQKGFPEIFVRMFSVNPQLRPTAQEIANAFKLMAEREGRTRLTRSV